MTVGPPRAQNLSRARHANYDAPQMRHITLSNLYLALDDLLTTKRLVALQSFEAGKASEKFLTLRRDKIKALPPELRGRPLADELAHTDERHDGIGGACWCTTEAVLRHPDSTPAMITAVMKIRTTFIPSLDALQARYEVEAKAAKDHEPELVNLELELTMFNVATGGTLYDWVAAFIKEGKQLDTLLSTRADAKDRKLAAALRNDVVSKVGRLREDLADALKDDPSLPADLDAQVFAYFDLLEAKDAGEAAEKAKAEAAAKKAQAAAAAAAPATPADPAAPAADGGKSGP